MTTPSGTFKMYVGSSGSFRGWRMALGSAATWSGGSLDVVPFDVVAIDTDGIVDLANVNGPAAVIPAGMAGVWDFGFQLLLFGNDDQVTFNAWVFNTPNSGYYNIESANVFDYLNPAVGFTDPLSLIARSGPIVIPAGQTMWMTAYISGTGGSLSGSTNPTTGEGAHCFFYGQYLGPTPP